jgi:hypothetical protein
MNMASVVSTRLDMEKIKQSLRQRGWFFLEANGPSLTGLNALGAGFEPYHRKVLPVLLRELREATRSARA